MSYPNMPVTDRHRHRSLRSGCSAAGKSCGSRLRWYCLVSVSLRRERWPLAEPDWNDLRVILALHRGRSVAAAARLLGVDASTVSRRLAAAEKAMGCVLINRGGREFHFTPEGERAAAAARSMEAALREAKSAIQASRSDVAGVVRIACPPSIVHFLRSFGEVASASHPDLGIELLSGRAPADLAGGEADISIRVLRAGDLDLVVAHRFDLGSGVYASRDYLAAHGAPAAVEDLAGHRLIRYGAPFLHLPAFTWIEAHADPDKPALRVDSIDMARSLIADGLGIGVLYCVIADRAPELVRVFPDPIDHMECAIVYHQSARGSARLRAVLDLLIAFFLARAGNLSGRGADA